MHPAESDFPPQEVPSPPVDWPGDPRIEAREPRNLFLLVIHQIVFRMGWILKTESVIMPAFLDWLSGGGMGWLRGCMPVLNRFGQSVPPVFCAEKLRAMPRKKRALAACVVSMCLPMGVLSAVCFAIGGEKRTWAPLFFLALYFVFFVFNGLYHLSFGTVQGKLIRPNRRGRLLRISTFYGSLPAMLVAWWLLPAWLELPVPGFRYLFAFTAVCFLLSGLTALLLYEPADEVGPKPARSGGNVSDMWRALRRDANLRRLVTVAMLFGTGLIIFPHYQAFAREKLGLSGGHLVMWVIVQNAAVGIYSLFAGPLADAWGNRLTMRMLIFGSAIAPLLAAVLPYLPGGMAANLFWMVFIALGVMPLVLRIVTNYALEICEASEHPRYLSTVSLCLAVPFLFSLVVGWLVDVVGFQVVFLSTSGLILLGGCLTFRLDEPRHRVRDAQIGPVGAGGGDE